MTDHTKRKLIEMNDYLMRLRSGDGATWEPEELRTWQEYSAPRLAEIYAAEARPLCEASQEVEALYRRALDAGEPLWNIVGQLLHAIVVNAPLGSMRHSEVLALARYASIARWVGLLADGDGSGVWDRIDVFEPDDFPKAIADVYAYEAGVLGRPAELTQAKWDALVDGDSLMGTAPGLIVLGWALHNDFVAEHEEVIEARTTEYLAMQSTYELDAAVV